MHDHQKKLALKLAKFAADHLLREDWHEPDEQEVSARIIGNRLDNAHGDTLIDWAKVMPQIPEDLRPTTQEFLVELTGPKGTILVNLADLLALAASQAPSEEVSPRDTGWWCCRADYGKHEPTCKNYTDPQALKEEN